MIRVRTAWHATHMTSSPSSPADAPVILEVALNGVTSRRRNPHVPATVEEHAEDALACVAAGATIIHTHAPNLFVSAEEAAAQYATAFRPVVERHPGIVCYPTVGNGSTVEDRYRHVELLDDMDLVRQGAVDTGSVNLGGTGPDGLPPASEFVYTNPFAKIGYEMQVCTARGLGPSVAIFEPGFLQVVLAYARADALPPGIFVKFYFAGGGYLGGGDPLWGAPPIIEALDLFLAMLGDAPVEWGVAVLGGSLLDTPIARAALERGGHLRVGIEDWDDGPPNVEQAAAAIALCAEVGRPPATISQTETLLGLPT
ncbi:MAG: 3-keto-5-aminohexanoate cleavage enzyme [Actinomycetota bacterium]|nr:3-keto-5-aminohexanoate cleavage enzyme [Actinomycetota bacterium]